MGFLRKLIQSCEFSRFNSLLAKGLFMEIFRESKMIETQSKLAVIGFKSPILLDSSHLLSANSLKYFFTCRKSKKVSTDWILSDRPMVQKCRRSRFITCGSTFNTFKSKWFLMTTWFIAVYFCKSCFRTARWLNKEFFISKKGWFRSEFP